MEEHDDVQRASSSLAEELMEKGDYDGAAVEAEKVLDELEPSLLAIARAALTRGKALKRQAIKEMSETGGDLPPRELFDRVWDSLELSKKLNPECRETIDELTKLKNFYEKVGYLPSSAPPIAPKQWATARIDVLVVGAGPAGIGTALVLTETFGLDKKRVMVAERGKEVGESFRRWPEETRFISPSFNQQGWTNSFDLNSISKGTSPAYSLHSEHPSGKEYAAYLAGIVSINKLNVRRQLEVVSVRAIGRKKEFPLFSVKVRSTKAGPKEENGAVAEPRIKTIIARYVVWAAGEFQYPRSATKKKKDEEEKKSEGEEEEKRGKEKEELIAGSEHCLHNSKVRSWAGLPGDDFVVIGGHESGVDAAVNLARARKRCRVLASTPCWRTTDPSAELAPYTSARLRDVMAPGFSPQPRLMAPLRVLRVEKAETGGFSVTAEWKKAEEATTAQDGLRNTVDAVVPTHQEPGPEGSTLVLHTPHPPVLCTGFEGSVAAGCAGHLFALANDGATPLLTENDESTKVPGVFLVGPSVSHGKKSFCFVHRFRQRFAIVANAISRGLGHDTRVEVAKCRKANMYLDDLASCTSEEEEDACAGGDDAC